MLGKTKVKYIQSLGQKKQRDAEGLFIAEGPKIVAEFLESRHLEVKQVYALSSWLDQYGALPAGTEAIAVSDDELAKLSQLATSNQVLAVVKQRPDPVIDPKGALSLALDTIQDPGNMGTIIRIADWFGISQLVCSMDCVDVYHPRVVQSTMGSLARVNVLYTGLADWLGAHRDIRVYAAVLEGQDVTAMAKLREGVILIGNESRGISPEVMALANVRVTIPRKGAAESLNAAVATGILLSHLVSFT
ncbi:MAG: RNA methyltransferase [Chitinophagaceae bacterium]